MATKPRARAGRPSAVKGTLQAQSQRAQITNRVHGLSAISLEFFQLSSGIQAGAHFRGFFLVVSNLAAEMFSTVDCLFAA